MQINVTGRQVEISHAFKNHVEEGLNDVIQRYQLQPVDIQVTLSKHGNHFCTDIASHIGRGVDLRAHGEGTDAYTSFTIALETLSGRLRKFKRRLVDHHKHRDIHVEMEKIAHYVLNGEAPDHEDNEKLSPAIIVETLKEIPRLSVGDAVMRMDLSAENAFIFREQQSGRLNMIYRRSDGNIGWVDPQ